METIYVVANESLPKLVKIGMSSKSSAVERVISLSSSTSIPTPFFVLMEWQVEDALKVESKLHKLCAEWRVSDSNEFFHTDCLNTVTSFMGGTIKAGEKRLRERSYKLEKVQKEINNARDYMWSGTCQQLLDTH